MLNLLESALRSASANGSGGVTRPSIFFKLGDEPAKTGQASGGIPQQKPDRPMRQFQA
jgi:hypothetical protein